MLLLLIPPLSFLAVIGLGCAFLVSLIRAGTQEVQERRSYRPWFWLAGALSAAEVFVHSVALFLYSTIVTSLPCEYQGRGSGHALSSSRLPLSTRCPGPVEMVPGWVNPTLAVLLLLAVSSLVAGMVCRYRRDQAQ